MNFHFFGLALPRRAKAPSWVSFIGSLPASHCHTARGETSRISAASPCVMLSRSRSYFSLCANGHSGENFMLVQGGYGIANCLPKLFFRVLAPMLRKELGHFRGFPVASNTHIVTELISMLYGQGFGSAFNRNGDVRRLYCYVYFHVSKFAYCAKYCKNYFRILCEVLYEVYF